LFGEYFKWVRLGNFNNIRTQEQKPGESRQRRPELVLVKLKTQSMFFRISKKVFNFFSFNKISANIKKMLDRNRALN
jgi:hypothetical protein